jgi:hypothetical protein
MRIELSIKTDYLPTWKQFHGIRELLQNARDAEVELSAKMSIRHRPDSKVLVIENEGCTIPHEALLFGHTTKLGRSDLAGRFGEGLKLAMLVLTREGHTVRVRSGSEVWTPKIERSEKFDADVLVVHVEKGRADRDRVQVEVDQIGKDGFDALKDFFLFLDKPKDDEMVKTYSGTILLGKRYEHKLFVKGIFVQNAPDISFGYDLEGVEIDRDRKMVDRYDLGFKTATIWREAVAKQPSLLGGFVKLLESDARDLEEMGDYNASQLTDEAKKHVADAFKRVHGADALPVSTLGDSHDVEHFGKKGVVVPRPLRVVLEQTLGTVEANKKILAKETVQLYGWHDLSANEKASLERAIRLVNEVDPITLSDIDVAEFRDEALRGIFKDERIQLSKAILEDKDMTLRVLVHEVAHKAGGGDGEKAHVANIERIWSAIVANRDV